MSEGITTAQVRITEFMADNEGTLMDEDGDYSDWIELHNLSTTNVNLYDWSLTDSAGNPTKWRLPATNVPPGAYLLVFASEKDRRTPGVELHTNFRLSAGGEYCALFRPDGTPATEFSPAFPPQFPDVSYGTGQQIVRTTLVASNASGRLRVPLNGLEDESWAAWDFSDGHWTAATNGVGYETGLTDPAEDNFGTQALALGPVAYWRMGELSGTMAANSAATGSSMDATYLGGVTLGEPGPRPPQFFAFEPDNTAPGFDGVSGHVQGPVGLLNGLAQFTIAGWVWLDGSQASRSGLFGQNDVVEFGFWNSGTTLRAWTPAGEVTAPAPLSTSTWHHLALVGSTSSLALYVDGSQAASTSVSVSTYGNSAYTFRVAGAGVWGTASDNYLDGRVDEVAVWPRALSSGEITELLSTNISSANYSPYIATDVEGIMHGVNASAHVRLPFSVPDPSGVTGLKLRMRYDDGFVALLNGHPMAGANAPATNVWNSTATLRHPDNASLEWEEFDVSASRFFLQAGTNVLGLHGLNINAANTDFLLHAELEAESSAGAESNLRYFTLASPGGPNGTGAEDLGPILSGVGHSPSLPLSTDALRVTAHVTEAFAPVDTVKLTYRVMYGSEVSLAMNDAGTGSDLAAGDGIWTATIPAGVAAPGQLIRYYVSAVDTDVNASRWPLFPHPTDSEEYLGTVAMDPAIETLLPVLHLFVDNFTAANNDIGTRASIFYRGELYDNVRITLHGQSSSSWPKKGYNFDFNSEHRFQYEPGRTRQRDIKMLSNYGDKTRLHTSLAYEMIARAGGAAHFSFPVRVQVNGTFFGIEDLVEDADELYLERLGRDPNGALYKLGRPIGNTGNLEKKARTWEGNSDLLAFAAAIDMSLPLQDRALYAWDNVDIPQTVNYFATLAILSDQDHGHKNLYLYHDNDRTGEWAVLPWDVDLTFGRNWVSGPGYFSDTLYTNNHLEFIEWIPNKSGSSASNRLYNLFFDYPDFRKMYLRRLRTLMDTQLMPPGTPTNGLVIEPRMRAMLDRLDPPGIATTDADLDQVAWGPTWGNTAYSDPRVEVERTIAEHLTGRRNWLFNSPSATVRGENIPSAQPAFPPMTIDTWDYNPVGGNQDQEYVEVHNPNSYAVDVTDWELDGGVRFKFRAGTVIPAGQSIYVSPNVVAFRGRTNGPSGGQGRYVQGPCEGHLNAWGESLLLFNPDGVLVNSNAFVGLPSDAQRYLRVTEIMYNPSPALGITNDAQQFEFIELKNISTSVTLDLSGVRFTNGIYFEFTGSAVTNLAPGESVLVVRNLAMFTARYGGGFNVAGEFQGALDNGGETLRLEDAVGEKILEFRYNNSWQPITDGLGFSLVIVDDQAPWNTWDNKPSWRISAELGGSPGSGNLPPPVFGSVLVNEVLTHTDLPLKDSVELSNAGTNAVDIGGWFLTDTYFAPQKYRIPNGTILQPGAYLVLNTDQFGVGTDGFAFSELGEQAWLFSGDTGTNLTGFSHGLDFGPAPNGVSIGRHVNSVGEVDFVLLTAVTLGASNAYPLVGPIVVSEIMYRPPDTNGTDNSLDEFLELQNIAATNVPLFDPQHPTNTWRLRNAVDYDFPSGLSLDPGARLLVVGFDPLDAAHLAAFRTLYNVPISVSVLGPWSGKLDNSGETIELKRPDNPNVNGTNVIVPFVMVEKIKYRDAPPWPSDADGLGNSLQRASLPAYADDAGNWYAAGVTAGSANAPNYPGDTDGDAMPDEWELANGTNPNVPDANDDLDNDGLTNRGEYLAGTSPTNAASALRFESAFRQGGDVVFSFSAVSNRTYTVQRGGTPGSWQNWSNVTAVPSNRTIWITNPITGSNQYHRLITPALP